MPDPSSAPRLRQLDARADAALLARTADRLFRETYAATHADIIDAYCAGAFGEARQAHELAEPGAAAHVMETDADVVAYAQLRRRAVPAGSAWEDADGPALEVARFYVDRRWHGAGLAPRLMDAVRAHAAADGARVVWLQVWGENHRAIAFYRRHGFTRIGTTWFDFAGLREEDHLMAARPGDIGRRDPAEAVR